MTVDALTFSRLRRAMRVVLMATSGLFVAGMGLSLLASDWSGPLADAFVWAGLALLVAIPVVNVLGVLVAEWRSRDWPFVAAAIAVLLLLAYTVIDKLGR